MFHCAVGVQELPAQADNGFPLPAHDHAGFLRHHGYLVGLQVFRPGGGDKGLRVPGGHHYGHALLAFGDGQLRAVQAVVLLSHGVQIDGQAVRQLADGDADAPRAEVITAFDEAGDLPVPEETLDFPLLRGVAFLDLAGHGLEGGLVVALRGARSPANAIPARAAPQKDDHVPGNGTLPPDVLRRGRAHHRAHLQVLGHIAGVVDFGHVPGGQADLVSVGGVARRRRLAELPLGELAGRRVFQGRPGIAAAREAHGLMDVGPAGKGVPDAAADAGGRAAEGLDLRGVVVGLVFEHEEPVLGPAVHHRRDVDGAGVDLLALVQFREEAPLFQGLGGDGGDVHKGLGAVLGPIAVDLAAQLQVVVIGGFDLGVLNLSAVDVGGEGGVAAVVGPVGVHHPDLRDGRVPLFRVPEVGLEELQVVQVHGQAQTFQQGGQGRLVHGREAGDSFDMVRDRVFLHQGAGLVQGGLPALHRVDEVAADFLLIFPGEGEGALPGALEPILRSGAHQGALTASHQLDALGGGVRPLVELARQGLHRQGPLGTVPGGGDHFVPNDIHLGLGKYGPAGLFEGFPLQAFHVVAVEDADPCDALDAQKVPQVCQQAPGLGAEAGAFFYIDTPYHIIPPGPGGPAVQCHAGNICRRSECAPRRRRRPAGRPPGCRPQR